LVIFFSLFYPGRYLFLGGTVPTALTPARVHRCLRGVFQSDDA